MRIWTLNFIIARNEWMISFVSIIIGKFGSYNLLIILEVFYSYVKFNFMILVVRLALTKFKYLIIKNIKI